MEINKGVGKRESKKPKKLRNGTSEIHPGRREQSLVPISWPDSTKLTSNWRTRRYNRFTKCLWSITLALHKLFHSAAEGTLTGITGETSLVLVSIYYLVPTVSLHMGSFSVNRRKESHSATSVYLYDMRSFSAVTLCNRGVSFCTHHLW